MARHGKRIAVLGWWFRKHLEWIAMAMAGIALFLAISTMLDNKALKQQRRTEIVERLDRSAVGPWTWTPQPRAVGSWGVTPPAPSAYKEGEQLAALRLELAELRGELATLRTPTERAAWWRTPEWTAVFLAAIGIAVSTWTWWSNHRREAAMQRRETYVKIDRMLDRARDWMGGQENTENILAARRVPGRDLTGAKREIDKAKALDPSYAPVHVREGAYWIFRRQSAKAEASYREALRLDPEYAIAHVGLGVLKHDRGDSEGAEASYREALRLDPEYAIAHYNLGNVQRARGDLAAAEAAYREALRLDSEYAIVHANLGVLKHDRGDLEGAETSLREALRMDPDHVGFRAALDDVLRAREEDEQPDV